MFNHVYMFDPVLELNGEMPAVKKLNGNGDKDMTPFEMNLKNKRCVCVCVKGDKDILFHPSYIYACFHCSHQMRLLMLSFTSFMISISSACI